MKRFENGKMENENFTVSISINIEKNIKKELIGYILEEIEKKLNEIL